MKVTFNANNVTLEAVGDTHKDLFEQLASLQEVFENTVCGICHIDNVRFIVRTVEDNNFYEMHCQNINCRARLAFGQHKKGGSLFPKRKDDTGQRLANNGWTKWTPEKKEQS
jgi:hypothetical protein